MSKRRPANAFPASGMRPQRDLRGEAQKKTIVELKSILKDLVQAEPTKASQVVESWLKQPSSKQKVRRRKAG